MAFVRSDYYDYNIDLLISRRAEIKEANTNPSEMLSEINSDWSSKSFTFAPWVASLPPARYSA